MLKWQFFVVIVIVIPERQRGFILNVFQRINIQYMKLLNHLRETVSVSSRPRTNRLARCRVRVTLEDNKSTFINPQLSTAKKARHVDTSSISGIYYMRMVRILTNLQWCKYWCWLTTRRFDYCDFILNTLQQKPSFFCHNLWIDEWMFT